MKEFSRRDFVQGVGALALSSNSLSKPDSDIEFLRKLVLSTLEGSRVAPGSTGPKNWPIKNSCGFSLVTPGRLGYPAFWIRDFSMVVDSGLVPTSEIENHFILMAQCQQGSEGRYLKSGGIIRPDSIPDHINFDGKAVFYPGTYSSGEDQGGEPWGIYPPVDDHFEFIHLAWNLARQKGDRQFLGRRIGELSLRDRLINAFFTPQYDFRSQLIETTGQLRAVGFGFCDSVTLTGKVLYPSLLRYRAATELSELTGRQEYSELAQQIASSIWQTFGQDELGWLRASTDIGRGQPDVWGALLALHLKVLPRPHHERLNHWVVAAYRKGTISCESAVRHIPTDCDFSATSAWEKALPPKGIYQNGAYWHTPTGWLIEAVSAIDLKLGRKAFRDYIAHLRKGGDRPWECFNPALNHYQNGGYLASVALPYSVLKDLYRD